MIAEFDRPIYCRLNSVLIKKIPNGISPFDMKSDIFVWVSFRTLNNPKRGHFGSPYVGPREDVSDFVCEFIQ